MTTPIIRRDEKGILTLYVKNRPFFIYGGEIHNSSASDSEYMEREVWPAVEVNRIFSVCDRGTD